MERGRALSPVNPLIPEQYWATHSPQYARSRPLETWGCTCLLGPPPTCSAAWNGTPPWYRSPPPRPPSPPLWMDGALRPPVTVWQRLKQQVAKGEAAPLTEMLQLTRNCVKVILRKKKKKFPLKYAHLNVAVKAHQSCVKVRQNQTGRERNKSFKSILNINSCYITCFLLQKNTFVCWKQSTCSVDKYSHIISSSAVQQRKDEVELRKTESREAFTLMCRMNEESSCDRGGTKLWFRAHVMWIEQSRGTSGSEDCWFSAASRAGLIETDLRSTWILWSFITSDDVKY